MQIHLLITTTVLLLLGSGCQQSVPIHDEQICSPIPLISPMPGTSPSPAVTVLPGSLGASCDYFLTANQQVLNDAQWRERQAEWISQGMGIECTTSGTIANIKAEIEKLCSEAPCNYETEKKILAGLDRISHLGVPR